MALTQTQISQLYVTVFGRSSEGAGNLFWQQTETSVESAATTMLATQASRDYFGSSLDSDQAFIEHIYANTLGKTIADDPEGIAFWVTALANGNSRGFIISELITAAQNPVNAGSAQDRFNNRVEVSNYVADKIEGAGLDATDAAAMQVFIDFNKMVTSNRESVLSAKAAVNATPQQQNVNASDLEVYDATGGDYNFLLEFFAEMQRAANIEGFGAGDTISLVNAPADFSYVIDSDEVTALTFGVNSSDYSSSWAINFENLSTQLVTEVQEQTDIAAKIGVLEAAWGDWLVA